MTVGSRPTPGISILISSRDGEATLGEQLTALARQVDAPPFEVVVVDNGSTDRTAEVAASFHGRLELTVLDAPIASLTQSLERAAKAARGHSLLILDDDDVVASEYVAVMGRALDHHPAVAARLDPTALNPGRLARSRPLAQSHGLVRWPGFLPWAQGCSLGLRREVLDVIGGMGDIGFATGYDVDLCWELQLAGFDLVFVPEAVVHYRFRHEPAEILRQARRYGRSSVARFQRWHHRGMPRSSLARQLVRWVRLLVAAPATLTPTGRRWWVFEAGLLAGRLEESWRRRTLYL